MWSIIFYGYDMIYERSDYMWHIIYGGILSATRAMGLSKWEPYHVRVGFWPDICNYNHLLGSMISKITCLHDYHHITDQYIIHEGTTKHTYNHRRKFRSQTSDNMERWKAEEGRGREKRKIRREKIRRERVRRQKIQMREKVGKSQNSVFFQWFGAPVEK